MSSGPLIPTPRESPENRPARYAAVMTKSPASAPVRLDDQLCLALYVASRAMTARYRPALASTGLTYPQYLVMLALWEHGSSTVAEIGHRLQLESSTLSPLLKRLEALELLTRVRGVDDERNVNITLTRQGRALGRRAPEIFREMCDATGMTGAQRKNLVAQLRALADQLSNS